MKFTKENKAKIWKIISDSVNVLEEKGYTIVHKVGSYNPKTKRHSFGKRPSDSISFVLGTMNWPCNMRARYYLELPKDLAEKILVLEHLPDLTAA